MMEVAENYAKKIIFTSDNNRGEAFQRIVEDATGASKFQHLTVIPVSYTHLRAHET